MRKDPGEAVDVIFRSVIITTSIKVMVEGPWPNMKAFKASDQK